MLLDYYHVYLCHCSLSRVCVSSQAVSITFGCGGGFHEAEHLILILHVLNSALIKKSTKCTADVTAKKVIHYHVITFSGIGTNGL